MKQGTILLRRRNSSKEFSLTRFNSRVRLQLIEVLDLLLIGYKNTSLVVLGSIFEEIITRHLFSLIADKKIEKRKSEIIKMGLDEKLGFMKGKKIITDKDWYIASKLKSDRNSGAHFLTTPSILKSKASKKESFEGAEETIKLVLNIMNKYQ